MANLSTQILHQMDVTLHEVYSGQTLPGISATVVHRQEPIWFISHGYASLEAQTPAHAGTVYHLGSLTKVFTALMLMQLRDVGKLQLDDPLDKYLPEVNQGRFPAITLKQLASHTSGFPLMPPLEELASAMQEFPPSMETLRKMAFPPIERIISSLPQVELLFTPGTQVAYSNLGIALLAHALERVTEGEYTGYVERQILHPLGMHDSGFLSTVIRSADLATCYLPYTSPPMAVPMETKMIQGFTPAGGLWSSTDDMARFLAFLTGPPEAAAHPLLSQRSLREMCQLVAPLEKSRHTGATAASDVGIGWFLSHLQGHLLAEHGGADPSTAAYLAWLPALDLAVFIATNTGRNPTAVAVAANSLLELVVQSFRE